MNESSLMPYEYYVNKVKSQIETVVIINDGDRLVMWDDDPKVNRNAVIIVAGTLMYDLWREAADHFVVRRPC